MKLEPMTPDPTPAWWVGSVAIRSGDGKEIARVRERKDFDANQVARRIAACVNACEGIPTEVLMRVGWSGQGRPPREEDDDA